MNNDKALEKIKKCLALAQSSNPHEAANTWRHAQALMRRYNIEHADVLASVVTATKAKGGASKTVARWEMILAVASCEAFECESIRLFYPSPKKHSEWIFIGEGSSPEVAVYAFEVLLRQVRKGRREFLANNCKGYSAHEKRRQVDVYSQAWVGALYERVQAFANKSMNKTNIQAYINKHYTDPEAMASRGVAKFNGKSVGEYMAFQAGEQAASETHLHHGMAGKEPTLLCSEV